MITTKQLDGWEREIQYKLDEEEFCALGRECIPQLIAEVRRLQMLVRVSGITLEVQREMLESP